MRRIYFAGKIDYFWETNWRKPFIPEKEEEGHDSGSSPCIQHEFEFQSGFVYCGPFFAGAHGSFDGVHGDMMSCWDDIAERARSQIRSCDVLLAWINSSDCFGTLTEIGFAAALGKPIFIGFEAGRFADLHVSEFSFIRQFVQHSDIYTEPTELFESVRFTIRNGHPPRRITRKRKVIVLPGPPVNPQDCFVYLIREIPSGRVKIGTTQDIEQRLKQLQTGNPDPLEVVAWYPGSFEEEMILKNQWKGINIRGEWFQPQPYVFKHFYGKQPASRDDETDSILDVFNSAEVDS